MGRFIEFSKKYAINIVLAGVMSVLVSMSNIYLVNTIKVVIDESLNGSFNNLMKYVVICIFIVIVGMVATYLFNYQTGFFNNGVLKDIKEKIITHFLKLSPEFVSRQDYGDLTSRLSNEVENISGYLSQYFSQLISLPIMTIVFSYYLLSIDAVLGLICLATIGIAIVIHLRLIEPVKQGQKVYMEQISLTNNNIYEVCSGIEIVKTYKLENVLADKYYNVLKKCLDTSFVNDKKEYGAAPLFTVMFGVPEMTALCYGGYLAFRGDITLGMLTAFITSMSMLLWPLSQVYQIVIRTKMALISADRVFYLLDCDVEDTENKTVELKNLEKVFEIDNLSYAYNNSKDLVLDKIDLEIKKGERIAFVGRSGCGKSTLLKLLYKNFDRTSGDLRFYGVDFNEVSPNLLRNSISLISQEVFLFPMSIMDNIKLAKPNATEEEVIEASRKAYCHEFITGFEKGYDTMVGEKGALLSGGQRQRISIARAFLKDSDIFMLDEPTSALDKESERLVNAALLNISSDKTVIVIAHRLDTITDFDKICVFEDKKISRIGTHNELMMEDGLYNQLYSEYINSQTVEV